MATGTVVVTLAPNFCWSLFGFFLMGRLGALTATEVSAVLSALHGPNRARAIPEANVLASLCTVVAPLCVSVAVTAGLSWRAGVSAAPFTLLVIALCLWRTELPQADPVKASSAARLPGLYWRHWTTLVLFTAAEFGVLYWAAQYLQSTGFITAAAAPLELSTFFLAMLTGRATGARLARARRRQAASAGLTGRHPQRIFCLLVGSGGVVAVQRVVFYGARYRQPLPVYGRARARQRYGFIRARAVPGFIPASGWRFWLRPLCWVRWPTSPRSWWRRSSYHSAWRQLSSTCGQRVARLNLSTDLLEQSLGKLQ